MKKPLAYTSGRIYYLATLAGDLGVRGFCGRHPSSIGRIVANVFPYFVMTKLIPSRRTFSKISGKFVRNSVAVMDSGSMCILRLAGFARRYLLVILQVEGDLRFLSF